MAQLPPSSRTGAAFSMVAFPHDERGLHASASNRPAFAFATTWGENSEYNSLGK